MTLSRLTKQAEKFAIDNSPSLLSGLAVSGVVVTAILTGKASFKAAQILEAEKYEMDLREKVGLVWKAYIPAAGAGAVTVACVISANQIGSRRAAAVAAAYSISEKAFAEYREKVVEKIGEKKAQGIKDEIAQDRVNRNPISTREVIISGAGEVMCYDQYTDRYFKGSMEAIKKAQNDFNYRLINDGYGSLTEFYDLLGLKGTSFSEEVGWTSEKMMEIAFSTTLSETGEPCLAIDFYVEPVRNFYRFH